MYIPKYQWLALWWLFTTGSYHISSDLIRPSHILSYLIIYLLISYHILSYLINWDPGLLGPQITSIKCVVKTPIPICFWVCSKWSIPPLFSAISWEKDEKEESHPWILQYQLGYPIFKQNDMILNVRFRASAHLYNDNQMIMEKHEEFEAANQIPRVLPLPLFCCCYDSCSQHHPEL